MNRNKYKCYKCFSNKQKNYLIDMGFEYITIAKDPKTDYLFWLFLRDDEFNKALEDYNNK